MNLVAGKSLNAEIYVSVFALASLETGAQKSINSVLT
jgi:hypothetical protein